MAETKVTSAEIVTASANGVKNTNLSTDAGEIGGTWTTWTPTWTGITPGNGVNSNTAYTKIGKTVICRGLFTGGTTSSGTGVSPTLTLPVTAATYTVNASPCGYFRYGSSGAYSGYVRMTSTTTATLVSQGVSGASVVDANLAVGFANGYVLGYYIVYEAA